MVRAPAFFCAIVNLKSPRRNFFAENLISALTLRESLPVLRDSVSSWDGDGALQRIVLPIQGGLQADAFHQRYR
jgi:hypothetical protein